MLKKYRSLAVLLLMMAAPFAALAAGGPPVKSSLSNPLAITLLIVIVGLLLAIGGLAYVVISAAQFYYQRVKEVNQSKETNPITKALTIIACFLLLATAGHAQETAEAVAEPVVTSIGGLSKMAFYTLVSVIGVELLVIFFLLFNLQTFLSKEKRLSVEVAAGDADGVVTAPKKERWKNLWMKLNSFRSIHEESAIELDHNYDGIRELDNKLPPWWLYMFYVCVLFSIVYMWRYHVSHSAPLSKEEFEIAMEKAEVEKQAYLAQSANNVDENTVKMLTDPAALESGKKIFTSSCAACHAPDGGGTVGPNLTDDYWLHGGNIKDVFKSIKYGWPDKGMKSWKDDFSPVQLAELASYVKSLHGTKPATPKEPQGELYKETDAQEQPKDSTVVSLK